MNIHIPPPLIFMWPKTGDESGFQAVPDASRFIGSPMFTVDDICIVASPFVPGIFIPSIDDISGVGVGVALGLISMPGIDDMSLGVGVGVGVAFGLMSIPGIPGIGVGVGVGIDAMATFASVRVAKMIKNVRIDPLF
jgi:hypothetical protein